MSNAFNPFAPQAPAQPVQAPFAQAPTPTAPAPVARPQRVIPQGLNDAQPADGFGTPYFKHLEGDWDVKVVGYTGVTREQSPIKGVSCHVTFEVLRSTTPDQIPIGSTWRIGYQYDWQRVNSDGTVGARADKDTYGKDAEQLSSLILALFNRKLGDGFDVRAAERYLREGFTDPNTKQHTPAPDLTVNPMYAHLSSWLSKPKQRTVATGGTEVRRYRNDRWTPSKP